MKSFIQSSEGRKLFNHQIPALISQLTRIADELTKSGLLDEGFVESPIIGRFEEISKTEQAELDEMGTEFDKLFKQLSNNFKLPDHFDEESLETIKNLARHVWNANKD